MFQIANLAFIQLSSPYRSYHPLIFPYVFALSLSPDSLPLSVPSVLMFPKSPGSSFFSQLLCLVFLGKDQSPGLYTITNDFQVYSFKPNFIPIASRSDFLLDILQIHPTQTDQDQIMDLLLQSCFSSWVFCLLNRFYSHPIASLETFPTALPCSSLPPSIHLVLTQRLTSRKLCCQPSPIPSSSLQWSSYIAHAIISLHL